MTVEKDNSAIRYTPYNYIQPQDMSQNLTVLRYEMATELSK